MLDFEQNLEPISRFEPRLVYGQIWPKLTENRRF